MSFHVHRRRFLQAAAAASSAAWLRPAACLAAADSAATVHEVKVISPDPGYYHGWPTLCRRRGGELIVTYSGGREGHVCPFGRVEMMTSTDDGASWTYPRVLLDGALDDRDSGCLETARGTLIVTTFTSLAYETSLLKKQLGLSEGDPARWPREKIDRWLSVHNRLSPDGRRAELGEWLIRSTDGGNTWGPRIATLVNSPHGPIALSDGRLLYPGKQLWTAEKAIGVAESSDDGLTWRRLAEIPTRVGDDATRGYHELHGVEVAPGRVVVHIRNQNPPNSGETLQTESSDGGKTWTEPHPIGVWGLPSHLLKLSDGRLLMTYGHRRPPFGNQARLSGDGGATWGEPLNISDDGIGGDLGYPSTVQLGSGQFVTVWYESMEEPRGKAVLRQATWSLRTS
jgi:sialidase-1